MLSLEEVKAYLRVDGPDEDELIKDLMQTAESLIRDVTRTPADLPFPEGPVYQTASLYAVAYLYEHREEGDHRELLLSLRSLLFGVREVKF